MKRSGGVTAAAISLIAANTAYCVHVFWPMPPIGREGSGVLITGTIFQLVFCAWGIVAGIGLLRLRRWARLCALTISALVILFAIPQLLSAPKLIRATTGIPTISSGHFIFHEYLQLIEFGLVPVALGFWWLILFARRGVRRQFAPAAPAGEGNPPAPRSSAVDAAAIVLFVGSAFALLLAVMMLLIPSGPLQSAAALPLRGTLIGMGVVYVLVAVWGVITGVGVIKRRPWGRILMIATAAIGAAFSVLGSFGAIIGPLMMASEPGLPASAARSIMITAIAIMLIPLGISIWWLVLFTRPRVALEFSSPGPSPAAPQIPLPAIEPQLELAVAPATSFAAAEIPLSIRIIAIVEILLAALTLLSPWYSKLMNIKSPLLIFGFLVHGWGVDAFYVVCGIAPILFCIEIFRRRSWGLDGLILFLLAQIVNYGLMLISPARARFNAELQAQAQSLIAQIKLPAGSSPFSPLSHMNLFQNLSFGVSMILFAVLLYFLITRRKAYREACRPVSPLSPPAAIAPDTSTPPRPGEAQ